VCARARWRKEEVSLGKPSPTFSLPTKRRLVGEELPEKLPVGRDLFFFNYPWGLPGSLDQTGGERERAGRLGQERRGETQTTSARWEEEEVRGDAGIQRKMRRWVLAIAIPILAAASAAALFLGAEAQAVQQGHQTERISGETVREREREREREKEMMGLFSLRLFPSCFSS
jgi:hypothetical protein